MNRYSIRFDDSSDAFLLGPDGWDEELEEAVRDALFDLSKSSAEGKYSLWLERFLSFERDPGEKCDAFLDEDIINARRRITLFLEHMGCTVGPTRGRRDEAQLVKRKSGNPSDVEIAIVTIRAFYRSLRTKTLFHAFNPCDVNGWEEGAAMRVANGQQGQNQHGHMAEESGHYFRTPQREYYPPLPHDPTQVAEKVLAALAADAAAGISWFPGAILLVRALADGGARFEDTHVLHAADWAVGSRFGRGIIAPDKGSKGLRDKTIVISEGLRSDLADSFDQRHRADPKKVPDMAGLRGLLAQAKFDELSNIPLFPNAKGDLIKYSNFNNDHFRPSMERNNVFIDTTIGIKRVTPHWLRHADVTKNVANVFGFAKSPEEIVEALKQLQEDYGWKTDMIQRYAANFFLTHRLNQRIATMDAINDAEEVKPRLAGIAAPTSASALLPQQIAHLHGRLPQ